MKSQSRSKNMVIVFLTACLIVLFNGTMASAVALGAATHHGKYQVTTYKSTFKIDGKTVSSYANNAPIGGRSTPTYVAKTWYFTPQRPSGSFSDGNGRGSEQINYNCSSYTHKCEQWGYQLQPAVQATVSTSVEETAELFANGSLINTYGYHNQLPSYLFHGSYPQINTQTNYTCRVTMSWMTNKGGHATLVAEWAYVVTLV
ncbi:hypothetical protein [Arthrobacter woluwensis]|uniref:hypothetical protein n=1 Tax=Arthrobacter woluwensis TaxID=156980 RepID=UPI0011B1FCE1|nr:hypothetical protein [Arthrobacter woluwensis]